MERYQRGLHAKMIISDRFEVLVSSSNLTGSSMTRNHEVGIWSIEDDVRSKAKDFVKNMESTLKVKILEWADSEFEGIVTKASKKVISIMRRSEDSEKESVESKTCPNCGGVLVQRTGKRGGFIGCINFPSCHYTRE